MRRIAADVVIAGMEPESWHVSAYAIYRPANMRGLGKKIPHTLLDIHRF